LGGVFGWKLRKKGEKMHWKCEEVIKKAKSTNNLFAYMFYVIQFYIYWFIFTNIGRTFVVLFIVGAFLISLELHATRPAANLNSVQKIKMEKLESELTKINLEIPKNEMLDEFDHSKVLWRSKEYPKLQNQRLKTLDEIRILKNKAFVQNGFESWQNRLMNALPRIWILNAHLKKLAYNERVKYNIRKDEEQK